MIIDETGWTEAALQGDMEALDRCFAYLRPRLQRYFERRVRTLDDAETLVQRTMAASITSLSAFRGECPFDRWVWRIAAHECIAYYRQAKRGASTVSLDDPERDFSEKLQHEPGLSPHEDAEARTWMTQLLEVAQEACSQEEWRVMLAYYRTESFDEVAEILKINPATVRSHFLRGRSKLLAALILENPELVGGERAIKAAISAALADPDSGLTQRDLDVIKGMDRSSVQVREVCMKIAKHLPNPLAQM
ncbi:MAG: hypothetical protein HONBIEJF_00611 [Fimbriimonadaceae bacterium]|nr:hypothetical protein [Fimbriimonadaceae bacterium]